MAEAENEGDEEVPPSKRMKDGDGEGGAESKISLVEGRAEEETDALGRIKGSIGEGIREGEEEMEMGGWEELGEDEGSGIMDGEAV